MASYASKEEVLDIPDGLLSELNLSEAFVIAASYKRINNGCFEVNDCFVSCIYTYQLHCILSGAIFFSFFYI